MRSWTLGLASSISGWVGALVIGGALVCAVLGTQIAPYDPLRYDPRRALEGPSAPHLLGTDPLGRDVFSPVLSKFGGIHRVRRRISRGIGRIWPLARFRPPGVLS